MIQLQNLKKFICVLVWQLESFLIWHREGRDLVRSSWTNRCLCDPRLRRRSENFRKRCSSSRTTSTRPRRSWWPPTRGSKRKRRLSRTWVPTTFANLTNALFFFLSFLSIVSLAYHLNRDIVMIMMMVTRLGSGGAWTTIQAKEEVEALEKKMQQLENELAQTQANLEQATHNLEEKEKALQNVSHWTSWRWTSSRDACFLLN